MWLITEIVSDHHHGTTQFRISVHLAVFCHGEVYFFNYDSIELIVVYKNIDVGLCFTSLVY